MIIVLLSVLFEKPDDLRPVGFDLPPKLFDRPEFPFAANKFQQVDRNGATVQIAVEPDHMRCHPPIHTAAPRPPPPETPPRGPHLPVHREMRGIHAVTRRHRLAYGKIGRRETEPAAEPVSADHFARNLKIHPEK